MPDLGNGEKQYVKIEVIEGFGPDELVKLVDARNSSNQVRDESLMNLANDFDMIKAALKGEPFADKIAYKEYETFDRWRPEANFDSRDYFVLDDYGPQELQSHGPSD